MPSAGGPVSCSDTEEDDARARKVPRRLDGRVHPNTRPTARGGTLEIVGQSDVDPLTATGAYTVCTIREMQPLARPLFACPPSPDDAIKTGVPSRL